MPRLELLTEMELAALSSLGNEWYRNGYLERARAVFEGLVSIMPHYARGHLALGVLLDQLGESSLALSHFDAFERLEPTDPQVDLLRAELYNGRGATHEACAALEGAKTKASRQNDSQTLGRIEILRRFARPRSS